MKKYLALYLTFFLYSIIAVLEKFLSGIDLFSGRFIIFYGVQFSLLFLYAILWQRVLKKFSLTTAYINKGSVFIFNGIWAYVLFNETFTVKEIIGIILIIVGIIYINKES